MHRRITACILVLLLVAPFVVTASADSSGLCFTATNDHLLELSSMTAFVGGVSYVPAKVFFTYGVYYNYFEAESTATLYNSSKQIYFDLTNGNSYDSYNTPYSVSAVFKYGQVYVPADWVCRYFGLGYSYISGTGYGDVLRLKNGGEVLSDSQFLDAATTTMRNRYNDYYGNSDPVLPSVSPSQLQPSATNGTASVSLCFIGLPSGKTLDSLDNYSVKVCFFVTAEEASGSPDTIRRICGSGHSIGIYCTTSPESECGAAADVIFEAAQVRPILVSSPAAIFQSSSDYADSNGYAYFKPAIELPASTNNSLGITSKLDGIRGYTSISVPISKSTETYLPYILQYVANKHITVTPLLETMV